MSQAFKSASDFITDNYPIMASVLATILVAWLVTKFGEIIIRKAVRSGVKAAAHRSKLEEEKREKTIEQIIAAALKVLVWPIAFIMILEELGVEITPLLAGAGIIGVALGFGAQNLVKDIIAGMFIISENQYGVGDVVNLDGTSGVVERITLRSTVLRDLDGIVHHVPNGTINRASNFTSEKSGINFNIRVSYDSDIDKVISVVNQVCQSLAEDPEWKDDIIETPAFLRIDDFGDNAIDIKITGIVQPLTQWDVTGELRKRLKSAFDKHGIEIPLPQRVIHHPKSK